jgi:hypothetical protein
MAKDLPGTKLKAAAFGLSLLMAVDGGPSGKAQIDNKIKNDALAIGIYYLPLTYQISIDTWIIISPHSQSHGALSPSIMAAKDPAHYLAVLKASYDYAPQSDDEIAVKEDQILYLVERTDEEYVVCSWW